MAYSLPLEPRDVNGKPLLSGALVRIMSVESCARELPQEDQARIQAIVGNVRQIVEFDVHGFVWLAFTSGCSTADFCLLPAEVAIVEG